MDDAEVLTHGRPRLAAAQRLATADPETAIEGFEVWSRSTEERTRFLAAYIIEWLPYDDWRVVEGAERLMSDENIEIREQALAAHGLAEMLRNVVSWH